MIEITHSLIRANFAHYNDRSPNRPISIWGVLAPSDPVGGWGLNSLYPLRDFLKGYAFLKTMIDTNQNLSGYSHLGRIPPLPLLNPPKQIPQSPRNPSILLGCLYQNPPKPSGPLLSHSPMIKEPTRLKRRRTKTRKRNQPPPEPQSSEWLL